jgi:two-component system, LuxR family, response regulator FixJ
MAQTPAATEGKRIVLVVDDDAAVRSSHKFSLELEGFDVRTYASPEDLLKEENLPESGCLITNYQMPTMNGLELVAKLRDHRVTIPAILVTGHSNENLRKRAASAGVPLVEKPFLGRHLVDYIRQAFEKRDGPDDGPVRDD